MKDLKEYLAQLYQKQIMFVKNGQSLAGLSKNALPLLGYCIGEELGVRVVFVEGQLKSEMINLGKKIDESIFETLGFGRVERVWNAGEYSVLGDIIIFWERKYRYPIRISLFDGEVEEIAVVDPDNRSKIASLKSISILKQDDDDQIVISSNIPESMENIFLDTSSQLGGEKFNIRSLPNLYGFAYSDSGDRILEGYRKQGFKIFLVSNEDDADHDHKRFDGVLTDENSLLSSSLLLSDKKVLFVSSRDLSGEVRFSNSVKKEDIFSRAKVGDYLVHSEHGVGVFSGITVEGEKHYIELKYSGKDRLLIPLDQGEKLSKFVGAGKKAPVLTGLNSGSWKRITKKAKESVERIAQELLQIYAVRNEMKTDRIISSVDDIQAIWDFSKGFQYDDTEDQTIITSQIISDLSGEKPMDRLIVGDVGFGKTELAVRAAFAVLNSGRQVAVLAPTTVLVEQHLKVFKERLGSFGFNIASLSRLVDTKDRYEIVEGLEKGTIDIVIGTHFLLNKSLKYKDLGLLIVDEEQRFGVLQKDKLKEKRVGMHVLSMSATPIPRTLNLALLGIRDMSILGSVPEGRKPIINWMGEYEESVVSTAITTELERKGQIYYVHNRVRDLKRIRRELEVLVEGLKVALVHGQMSRAELASEMSRFINREYDLLLSTTIIENGLDLPNVNTLIVDDAQKYGLSQLYQIRGRIGRSDRQAYAYFMYSNLRGDAKLRLDAVNESQELGSGYLISNRDLEIRGAGNILGKDQSGTINSVGYSMYIDLLEDAITKLKGDN